ncbi:alpha/beta hydrolase fold [Musa troglodytarum]|uniref:Alpha/beta hydrolase fold n=1 Tax=Musa troglodytarum TaxID=320322 RepID=A0A9E7K6V7_9LILI|nr:alpha/beta hydrolase fold [Musa troglodytarum]
MGVLPRVPVRASHVACAVLSVDYRLAPENRFPAAYEDGLEVVRWVRQQAGHRAPDELGWWCTHCDFRVFLDGDSAGAAIAYNVAVQLDAMPESTAFLKTACLRGFCKAMRTAGKSVEEATYAAVGHAFQVLHNFPMAHTRTIELLTRTRALFNNG